MGDQSESGRYSIFTRRRMLSGAAAIAFSTAIGSTLKTSTASPSIPVSCLTGYNDAWKYWVENGLGHSVVASHVAASSSDVLRQNFQWQWHHPCENANDFEELQRLVDLVANLAVQTDTKILPCITTVPVWARSASGGILPQFLDYFGQYVAEIARRLSRWRDEHGILHNVLAGIEIGNEPNFFQLPSAGNTVPPANNHPCNVAPLPNQYFNPWCMSYEDHADLVTYAYSWIEEYKNYNYVSPDTRIIAGGLFATWTEDYTIYGKRFGNGLNGSDHQSQRLNWCEYLYLFESAVCAEYDVGIHPYYLGPYSGNPQSLANKIANSILAIVDQALYISSKDIWITETGATSKFPVEQQRQSTALQMISNGMNSRPRCKSLLVHSLFSGEGPDSPYHQFGVIGVAGNPLLPFPKPAFSALATNWSN